MMGGNPNDPDFERRNGGIVVILVIWTVFSIAVGGFLACQVGCR